MWPRHLIVEQEFPQKILFSILFLVLFESVSIFGAELDTLPEIAISVKEKEEERVIVKRAENSTDADQEINYPVCQSTVIVSAVGSFIILILILALVLCGRRNRKLKQLLRNLSDAEVEMFHCGDKTRDPTEANCEIHALAYEQRLEIHPNSIQIDEKLPPLGAGAFGIVRAGFLKSNVNDKESGVRVAIKMPKFNVTLENFISFLGEIKTLSTVQNHENILKILGASTLRIKQRRALMVLEFCELGNLKNFLRDKRHGFRNEFPRLSLTESEQVDLLTDSNGYGNPGISLPDSERLETTDLLNFAFGVANGMRFLEEKRVIHGDLAARNILLTRDREVKISDFAWSTQLRHYENYTTTNAKAIPWRWYPLEALVDRTLSLKSDCWSYGILLYEIFSLGEDPYPSFDRLEPKFVQSLRDGHRNERPEFASEEIYDLMTECWQKNPLDRPEFTEICDEILDMSMEIIEPKLNLI